MSTQNTEFAFGADYYANCACPAIVAGFKPRSGDGSSEVASRYDTNIRAWVHPDEPQGIVDEQTAQEHWMEAVRDCEELGYDQPAEVGREIAEKLGWL